MMTDPIADLLTRIRNAQQAKHTEIQLPYSRLKYDLASLMQRVGLVGAISKKDTNGRNELKISLKYAMEEPVITGLKRISKPGQRIYSSYRDLSKITRGTGMLVISTSTGLCTDAEARKQKVGGEVICQIW